MKKLFLFGAIALLMASCYQSKMWVGSAPVQKSEPVKIAKKWNHSFLFGLIPSGQPMNITEAAAGYDNYLIKTKHSFGNMVVHVVTFGIYTPTTTLIKVSKEDAKK